MKIRSSILWFVVIIAVLIALALWFGKKKSVETPLAVSPTTNAAPSAVTATSPQASAPVHTNVPPAQIASSSAPTVTGQPQSPLPQDKVTLLKGILQANDADIVFYGRLEDQFGNALGNVPINFEIRYENVTGKGVQRGEVTSDANGLFNISGYKGERLSFIPEKPGYVLTSRNNGGIYSPEWPEEQRAHPDPNNPVVIKMWKLQGGERLIRLQAEIRVPIDGTPINLDLQTGQIVHSGGDLTMQVKTTPTPNILQRYDWQVTIQSVNGGLISSSEDFERMLHAPDTGYNSEFDIAYQKDVKPWSTTFNGIFYFTSRGGGSYGKLGIEILSDVVKDGTVPVILNSYVNPSGSRNLEIDPQLVTEAKL